MKVGIKKLDGVIGDMELVKKQTVSYETMYSNKLRTTTEYVYRIELIFKMSDGSTHVSTAYISKFAYKPAGSVLGRYPIDDLAKFHEALGKLVIQDLDVNKYAGILDEAAAQFVHYYGASRNPNFNGRETIRSVANRLNQICD